MYARPKREGRAKKDLVGTQGGRQAGRGNLVSEQEEKQGLLLTAVGSSEAFCLHGYEGCVHHR